LSHARSLFQVSFGRLQTAFNDIDTLPSDKAVMAVSAIVTLVAMAVVLQIFLALPIRELPLPTTPNDHGNGTAATTSAPWGLWVLWWRDTIIACDGALQQVLLSRPLVYQ
jgi:hypothetical protein